MEPGQLKAALRELGLAQVEFAELLGASPRSGQNWASAMVPPPVATMAALLLRRPELIDDLREIAAQRAKGQ